MNYALYSEQPGSKLIFILESNYRRAYRYAGIHEHTMKTFC
jgi:hypothetical protein